MQSTTLLAGTGKLLAQKPGLSSTLSVAELDRIRKEAFEKDERVAEIEWNKTRKAELQVLSKTKQANWKDSLNQIMANRAQLKRQRLADEEMEKRRVDELEAQF